MGVPRSRRALRWASQAQPHESGFADRYANKGEEMGDEYTAAADDLFYAKRDDHGRIEISRATFELVIAELDWCYSELARRETEDQ